MSPQIYLSRYTQEISDLEVNKSKIFLQIIFLGLKLVERCV